MTTMNLPRYSMLMLHVQYATLGNNAMVVVVAGTTSS